MTLDRQFLRLLKYLVDSAYTGMVKIGSHQGSHVSRKRKPGRS